jgi:hypothetical protein
LNIGESRVSCTNHSDWAIEALLTVVGGEPGAAAKGLEGFENGGPCFVYASLDVDEEVESLPRRGIEDAILLAFLSKGRLRVEAVES